MAGLYMGLAPSAFPDTTVYITPQSGLTGTTFQVGVSAGFDLAAGTTSIYGYNKAITTAMTGTVRGVRGNAICFIDASTGDFIGVEGRAGNGTSASAHDGLGCTGKLVGGYFYVAGSGIASGNTVTSAYAVNAELDLDSSGLTVTNAYGVRINVQGGQGSTLTNLYGLVIEHESVDGTGATMDAAIMVKSVNSNEPITVLIDCSSAALASHDTDQWPLFKIPGGITLSWDVSASGWVSS
jgi:hypothetical protein